MSVLLLPPLKGLRSGSFDVNELVFLFQPQTVGYRQHMTMTPTLLAGLHEVHRLDPDETTRARDAGVLAQSVCGQVEAGCPPFELSQAVGVVEGRNAGRLAIAGGDVRRVEGSDIEDVIVMRQSPEVDSI
jgi:hypothetical protein